MHSHPHTDLTKRFPGSESIVRIGLCGFSALWILFIRPLFVTPVEAMGLNTSLSIVAVIMCLFCSINEYRLGSTALRRSLLLFLIIVISGYFVPVLKPGEHGSDTIEYASSLVLFSSRLLPFVGFVTFIGILGRFSIWGTIFKPFEWWMRKPVSVRVVSGSIVVFGITASMAIFGYECMPRVDDGVVNLFQARIFASGRISLPPPPDMEAFRLFGMIQQPRWIGQFPPGTPAVFALGLLTGAICLINPILSALTVFPIYRVAERLFDSRTASVSILIFIASPFVTVVGASFRNHALTLFLLSWSTALFLNDPRTNLSMTLSGFFGGLALLARPYTAVLWCGGLMVALLITDRRSFFTYLLQFSIGTIPGIVIAAIYTLEQTGGILVSPPVYLHGEEFDIGFGPRVMGDHTVLRAISHTMTRIEALGRMILGWPFHVVLFPFALWATGKSITGNRFVTSVIVMPVTAVVMGYSLYWCLEFTHGPRFLYSLLALLVPLIAHSLKNVGGWITSLFGYEKERVRSMLGAALILCLIYSVIGPWRETIRVFGSSYGCAIDLADYVHREPQGKKLIFYTIPSVNSPGHGWGFLMNDLDLSGDIVVAIDGGDERNRRLADIFPDRTIYRYEFDPINRQGKLEPMEIEGDGG